MPCYKPLTGFRSKDVNPNGKRSIVFVRSRGFEDRPVTIPCGQCVGCRLERSRQWAVRCVHEAQLYDDNCFVTLTYNDLNLPPGRSLRKRDFQNFMKRLRKAHDHKIRFFHCGEYGETYGRPHYHACLFNHDFKDKKPWKTQNGNQLFVSESLSALWPLGFSSIGAVTFESAAYVARYIMKKVTGERAKEHYQCVTEHGEVIRKEPEYVTMSRRPGIGHGWYDKYKGDVFPSDFVVVRGVKMRPPKYYDKQHEVEQLGDYRTIRSARIVESKNHKENNTPERLKVREKVQEARLKLLPRTVD